MSAASIDERLRRAAPTRATIYSFALANCPVWILASMKSVDRSAVLGELLPFLEILIFHTDSCRQQDFHKAALLAHIDIIPCISPRHISPPRRKICRRSDEAFRLAPGGWLPGTRSDALRRAAAACLARRRFAYPMVAIAKALGFKGHGGVRTAVARVEAARKRLSRRLLSWRSTLLNIWSRPDRKPPSILR